MATISVSEECNNFTDEDERMAPFSGITDHWYHNALQNLY